MNDQRINTLVRMALDAEQLESEASPASDAPPLRLVGTIRRQPVARPAWRINAAAVGLGLAAAAVLAFVVALPAMRHAAVPAGINIVVAPKSAAPGTAPMPAPRPDNRIVRHIEMAASTPPAPSAPVPTATSAVAHAVNEPVDPGLVERCLLLAIYRGQQGHVQCVKMKPYEWSENKCLSEVTPQELRCASVGQACTASADHALIVAMSGPQKMLPRSDADAVRVATCIVGAPCENDAKCLSLSAAQCLPANVSVKIESVAESR